MKKHLLAQSPVILACCLVASAAQAQGIKFRGDTAPTGDFGGRQDVNMTVSIGEMSTGSLDITSGVFSNGIRRTEVARYPGGIGTVNVSGGGEWETGTIWSGLGGKAIFNILNGGKVSSNHTYFGMGFHAEAIVTVDGPGSVWDIPPHKDGDFWIASQGASGTLRVLNGGQVSTSSDIYAAMDIASSAFIEIDGANSSLSADDLCYLGMAAPASIKITNGGSFSCGYKTYLGWGEVSLSGAGSKWIVGTNLDIGRTTNPTKGTLSIGEGSTVEVAGDLRLAAEGTGRGASGSLYIDGTRNPGILKAQKVIFGSTGYNSINFKHSDTSGNYTFSLPISGAGSVNVTGNGTTTLTGNNSYQSRNNIHAGILRAGSATAFPQNSVWSIGQGGTLDVNRHSLTAATVTHAGDLILGAGDTSAVFSVNTYYSGYGGNIHLNGALAGNHSPIQKVVVGSTTTGTTTLNIRNLGGAGAQTIGNGILVVEVGFESNGHFSLPAPGYVQVGAFRYTLAKVGRNWYLQSARTRAKTAAADEQAACDAGDPLAPACTLTPGNGAVATAKPAALTASAADAAEDAAAPTADTSAELDGAANGLDDLKDGEAVRLAEAVPVPSLGAMGIMSLSSIMGIAGLRRSRKLA